MQTVRGHQDMLSEFYSPSMLPRLHISATGFMRRLLRLQSVTRTLQRFISPIAYVSLTPYSVHFAAFLLQICRFSGYLSTCTIYGVFILTIMTNLIPK